MRSTAATWRSEVAHGVTNSRIGIDLGIRGTREMHDVNHDGRADFCRSIDVRATQLVACDFSGDDGFLDSGCLGGCMAHADPAAL